MNSRNPTLALSLAVFFFGPFLLTQGASAIEPSPALQLVQSQRVLVIAHRGNSSVAPENTLPAFRSALEVKPDLIELDYFHSRDGFPVVIHDADLDRTTNAFEQWKKRRVGVSQRTLAELKLLDAGAWKGPQFRGTRIPTLAEALDVIQTGSTTLIERKGGDAATCIELLRQKNCLDRVVVQSFDWRFVTQCRRLAPELVLAALGDKELTDAKLEEAAKLGVQVVGWNQKFIRAAQIQAAHRRGLKLWVYTANDANRIRQLARQGIDGIITDRPALAAQILR